MITKEQHQKFLSRTKQMRDKGFDIYLNDQRIVKIDEHAIYTTNYQKVNGQYERVKYSFEESIKPYLSLKDLYRKITFRISLMDVFWDLDFRQVGSIEWSLEYFNKDIAKGSDREHDESN